MIFSCKDKGCTDPNASNFNPDSNFNDGVCYHNYLSLISIDSFYFRKPTGFTWDEPSKDVFSYPYEDNPDLVFKIYNANNDVVYNSKLLHNFRNVPNTLTPLIIQGQFYNLAEDYRLYVFDIDENSMDTVFFDTFNLMDLNNEQKLVLRELDTLNGGSWYKVSLSFVNF